MHRNVDVRADIYGLGCTLFKLLTGRAPYVGEQRLTAYQRIRAHIEEPIPSALAIRTNIPPELDALLTKMLAKSRADRIQTPEELEQQLAPFCAGHDLPALTSAAAGDPKAEVDTAGASGETFTYALGIVPAQAPERQSTISSSANDVSTPVGRTPRPSKKERTDGRGVRPTWAAAIASTLLSIAIAYYSGLIFKVKTPGGTIVLECDPSALTDANIEIDGEQVQLQLTGDNQLITIGGAMTLVDPDGEPLTFEGGNLPAGPFFIQAVDLQGTPANDADLARLAMLSRIQSLALPETQITGEGLKQLALLKTLTTLVLGPQNKLGDVGYDAINQLENLTTLGVGMTDCTDEQLMRLARLSKLEYLGVNRNPKLTNRGIEFLLQQNQQLDQLQMSSEPEGGVYDPSCIVHAPKLSRLVISAAQLNDSAFAVVANHPTLSWLRVEFTTNRDELLMDQVVALIIQRRQLTQVDLVGYAGSAFSLIEARGDELRSKRPDITLTIASGGGYLKVYEPER